MANKINDPFGERGVHTLNPGQRRIYSGAIVTRIRSGGYSVTMPGGEKAWYLYVQDVVIALRAGHHVEPEGNNNPLCTFQKFSRERIIR